VPDATASSASSQDPTGSDGSPSPTLDANLANPTAVPTANPTTRPTPKPTPKPTQVPPPPVNGTFAWGMWAGQPWSKDKIQAAITLVGHSPAILLTYQHWDRRAEFLDDDARVIESLGATWMVTWEPDGSLQSITQGQHIFIMGRHRAGGHLPRY
jgi:hypothetical protein